MTKIAFVDPLRRTVLALLVVLGSAAVGAPARAADAPLDDAQAAAVYDRGRAAFKAGHFTEAANLFTSAYDHFKDKNILWNVGVAWEKAGELEVARDRFKEFLAHDDVDAQLRNEAADALIRVGGKLAARQAARTRAERVSQYEREKTEAEAAKNTELVAKLDQLIASERAAAAAENPGEPGDGDLGNVDRPPLPDRPDPTEPPAASGGSNVGGWVLLASGGAVLAGGVVMFFLGQGKFDTIDDAHGEAGSGLVTTLTRQEALDLESEGSTFQTLGAIGIGVGAAAVATGILMFTLADGEPETSQRVQVGVAPSPGGFDVHFATRF